jgi:hypothetical protein
MVLNKNFTPSAKDLILMVILLFPLFTIAQQKINIDLNFTILKSITNDILKNYVTEPSFVSVEYYKRKKFHYPYFNLLSDISYSVTNKLKLGLQTGMYVHYQESYSSQIKRTTLTIPVQITIKYPLLTIKNNTLGVNTATGIHFFSLDEYIDKYKNSALLNLSLFYTTKNGGLLKIGMEKQIDNVTVNLKNISQYSPQEKYKHCLNRLALSISYGVKIK